MKKSTKPQPLTRSEKKAAELDRWVKKHVAERRAADQAKKSRLRELRMARQAQAEEPSTASGISKPEDTY